MKKNNKYPIDKTSLTGMTFEDADDHVTYWKNKTESERLNAACYIINQIFNVTPSNKVNFLFTDKRKHA